VIGKRDARHAVFGGATAESIDAARAVEERILAVYVEVDERRLRHGRQLLWEARWSSLRYRRSCIDMGK
jgi:predicted kinase